MTMGIPGSFELSRCATLKLIVVPHKINYKGLQVISVVLDTTFQNSSPARLHYVSGCQKQECFIVAHADIQSNPALSISSRIVITQSTSIHLQYIKMLRDLWHNQQGNHQGGSYWNPKPHTPKHLTVLSTGLERADQFFWHGPPLLAIRIPLRIGAIASASLATPARGKPHTTDIEVEQASHPGQPQVLQGAHVQLQQSSQQRGICTKHSGSKA